MNSTVLFRMNGVAPGFLREYGCRNCSQCSSEKPQAHISASLLIKNSWRQRRSLRYHILFDCGMGAIDSLIDFGAPPVDFVFISHGHPSSVGPSTSWRAAANICLLHQGNNGNRTTTDLSLVFRGVKAKTGCRIRRDENTEVSRPWYQPVHHPRISVSRVDTKV